MLISRTPFFSMTWAPRLSRPPSRRSIGRLPILSPPIFSIRSLPNRASVAPMKSTACLAVNTTSGTCGSLRLAQLTLTSWSPLHEHSPPICRMADIIFSVSEILGILRSKHSLSLSMAAMISLGPAFLAPETS